MDVPLGVRAYKRAYAGEAEIRLENRFVEQNPTNLREKIGLVSRPGSTALATFGTGPIRGLFSKDGLFGGDLFVVSGPSLYRYDGTHNTQITGILRGTGNPAMTWMKGIGYQYAFIADGFGLFYYNGGTQATDTLTLSGGSITNQVIVVDGVYYTWTSSSANFTNLDNGTISHPYQCLVGASDAVSLANMANMINGAGTPGVNFSATLLTAAAHVTAASNPNKATGTLTLAGGNHITNQVIQIAGIWYGWSAAVDSNSPQGSLNNPFLAQLGANDAESLANMAKLLNFTSGQPGTDFSTAVAAPSPNVTATSTATTLVVTAIVGGTAGNSLATTVQSGSGISWGGATLSGGSAATTLVVTSISVYADGNSITASVSSGSFLTWGTATLTGGNVHALTPVAWPGSTGPLSLAAVSGYVLISQGLSQVFYWLNPGSVIIDALNFASKESNPDNILDMITVGDQVVICGDGSTENWYASGNFDVPFLPIEGRVYQRGVIQGTLVKMLDSVCIVSDDMKVYTIGYQFGQDSQWGVRRVSDHGIEERIRTELRSEAGAPP